MKAVVAAFNQEKALVGAFSVISNLRMELFEALVPCRHMPCCYLLEFAEFVGNYVDGPSVIGTLKWLGATLLQKSV